MGAAGVGGIGLGGLALALIGYFVFGIDPSTTMSVVQGGGQAEQQEADVQRTHDRARQRAEGRGDELEDREQDRAVEDDAQQALASHGDRRIDGGAHGGSGE